LSYEYGSFTYVLAVTGALLNAMCVESSSRL
jgi:hypothetical protein